MALVNWLAGIACRLQQRAVVVREPGGVLRFATHEERDRMLNLYFPRPGKMYVTPKMFSEDQLEVMTGKIL